MPLLHIDMTVPSYAVFGVVVYYALLFGLSARRRGPARAPNGVRGTRCTFVMVVPAHDEEVVLDQTLQELLASGYSGTYRVVVVNDASTDGTGKIAARWALADARVRVIERPVGVGGKGKGEALNHAYRQIELWRARGDDWLGGAAPADVVVGVLDADGRLGPGALDLVSEYFADPMVGTTQIGVRIGNARKCTLTRMQDMEFVGFSWLVQIARDHIGSSGLGGNGQFTRLAALSSLGEAPWSAGALTEDLDLGLKLVEVGWKTRFCHNTYVEQQGLDRWRPLLRQRTRWMQGHYQCWRHIPRLVRCRNGMALGRLDLVLYLVMVVTVVVVSATSGASLLAMLGFVRVSDSFLSFIPPGIAYRSCSLLLSLLPIVAFMWTYQRHSENPYRWYEVPAFALIFTLYTYVWLLTTVRALGRMVLGRKSWVKTPRVVS